jgi:hypothetical protein
MKYGGDTQRKSKCKGKLIHASLFDFEAPEALVNPCIFSTILSHKKRKKKTSFILVETKTGSCKWLPGSWGFKKQCIGFDLWQPTKNLGKDQIGNYTGTYRCLTILETAAGIETP